MDIKPSVTDAPPAVPSADQIPQADAGVAAPLSDGDESASITGDQVDLRHQILVDVYGQTRRADMPAAWAFLPKLKSVRQLRSSPTDLANSLRKFPRERLLETNVFEQGPDNEPRLNPVLNGTTSKLVFLGTADRTFQDIIGEHRGLSFGESPAVHFASERYTQAGGPLPKALLLVAGDDDLHVVRSLGVDCTWAGGLAKLTGAQFQEFFGPSSPNAPGPVFKLVLVAWQVAKFDKRLPPVIDEILTRLTVLEKLYGIDSAARCEVWLPNQINPMKWAVEVEDRKLVRDLFMQSLQTCKFAPAEARSATQKRVDLDFGTARARLQQALRLSRDVPRPQAVRDAVDEFQRAFETTVLKKFHKAATASGAPMDSTLWIMAAELAKHWFEEQEILLAAQRVVAMEPAQFRGTVHIDELPHRLQLVDALLKIHRSLKE